MDIESDRKEIGNKILTYLPIFTFISLGIGITNQLVYYYPFHVDILTYIDVNEIALDTFTNLIICISIVLVGNIIVELIMYIRNRTLKITDVADKRLTLTISLKTANIIVALMISFFTILLFIFYDKFDKAAFGNIAEEWHVISILTYIIIVIALSFPIYFRHIYEANYFVPLNFKYYNVFFSGLVIFYWSIYFSAKDAEKKIFLSTYGTYMVVGSDTIKSDMNYYYIGRTKNFIFFYNTKDNFTDIYQNKDVKVLSINNKGFTKTIDLLINKFKIDSINKKKIDSLKALHKLGLPFHKSF